MLILNFKLIKKYKMVISTTTRDKIRKLLDKGLPCKHISAKENVNI